MACSCRSRCERSTHSPTARTASRVRCAASRSRRTRTTIRTRSTRCCSEPMRRLLLMALLATAVFGTEAGAAVRVYRPNDAAQVVLQLGSSSGESQLGQLRAASLEAPADVDATLRYVDALIAAGTRSGNERYYGY